MVKFIMNKIGLIDKTELTLNDVTVICGKNNTGKTYISYSIYGFLYMWRDLIDFKFSHKIIDEVIENGFCTINIDEFESKVPEILVNLSKKYTSQLSNVFSVDKEWFQDSQFLVEIQNYNLNLSTKFESKLISSKKDVIQLKKDKESNILEVSILNTQMHQNLPSFILVDAINKALGEIYFSTWFKNPFIITSERTGISLFYKELDINKNIMVEHIAKNKNLDPFKILKEQTSRYAIPIRHNIDYTREMGDGITKEKSFLFEDKELLKYFSDILQGTYKIINKEVYFITKKNKKQIPMYFSSSATKSLIELFFFIRYTAKKGDILIIDEPELNLHPDNHRYITRLLAHLSNKDINVFITTHSDYMIKEFNNLIRLNHTITNKEKVMKKYDYKEQEILSHAKISSYINNEGTLNKVHLNDMGMEISSFDDTINCLSSSIDDIYFNIEE